jgi:hypothetical protein
MISRFGEAGRHDSGRNSEDRSMKYFLIKYRFQNGSQETWHRDVAEFIAALDGDPDLQGKISYRCMKSRDGADYYHLAATADDAAAKTLQTREFFSRYTDQTKPAGGGAVDVVPIEIVAETRHQA